MLRRRVKVTRNGLLAPSGSQGGPGFTAGSKLTHLRAAAHSAPAASSATAGPLFRALPGGPQATQQAGACATVGAL